MSQILSIVLLAATAAFALAEPPTVTFPAKLEPVGQFAIQDPGADVVSAVYIPSGHANEPFPVAIISPKDPEAIKKFVFDRRGLADGNYAFIGVFAGKTGEQVRKDFVVVVGKPVTGPVDPPPGTLPSTGRFYALVRADGPSAPEWSKMLKSSSWAAVEAKGYQWKEYTVSEAAAKAIVLPPNTKLPAMLVYKKTGEAGGKPIFVQDGDTRTPPSSDSDILKLAE